MQPDVFNNETLHVVDYFNGALQIKNEKVINDVFTNYVLNKSKVDFNANRSTADNINKLNQEINRENKEVKASKFWMIFFRIIGVALAFVGIIFIVLISLHHNEKISPIWLSLAIVLPTVGITIFGLSWLIKKHFITNTQELQDLQNQWQQQFNLAMSQLANLKSNICWYLTYIIFEQTYPLIEFARYFSEADYLNWTDWLKDNVNSTVLYCLSGNVKTNPFIVLKTKSTEMYDHVYTGSRTVMVRRTRVVNGRTTSYMAPKIVVATITNPAPRYWTDTKLFFKSAAAESLDFVNMTAFKNEKKAEKYFEKNKSTEPMDNPEFDRYFPCERNDEVQFRTLFSPLAQEEMIKLMKVKNDYKFTKHGMLNIISSPSFDTIAFNINYNYFTNEYDYEKIKVDFVESNKKFFRDIYFMFAPILTIPLYQQYQYRQPIFEKAQQRLFAAAQNESIVNTMYDSSNFKHPQSITDNIFKTKRVFANSLYEINEIIAYGYRGSPRMVIVPVADFEAGIVNVPVTVIDYFSVKKSTHIVNSFIDKNQQDFYSNQNNFTKNSWTEFQKKLGVSDISKKGNFFSMSIGDKTSLANEDSYKAFLKSFETNA